MNSRDIYINKFEELLLIEKKFRDLYKYHVDRIKDPILLEKFKRIYEDEKKHVEIVQNFIKMASE